MNPIEFEFKIKTNSGFKIELATSYAEKLREIPNQSGVYIWLSENIDFWKSFKDCACQKLPNEFKETIDSGAIISVLVKDTCLCDEKFTSCNNLILIGQSENLQRRIKYFVKSLTDGRSPHSEGLRIRKLLENCYNSSSGKFKFKLYLIPTSNEDTAKQLEALLLNVYKLSHGCLPLFNKKIEGFKLYFL